ncbi:hypothetical protein N2152v2_001129 [Parachlorella kessleri]
MKRKWDGKAAEQEGGLAKGNSSSSSLPSVSHQAAKGSVQLGKVEQLRDSRLTARTSSRDLGSLTAAWLQYKPLLKRAASSSLHLVAASLLLVPGLTTFMPSTS